MLTRNAIVVSISIVLLLVSVALVSLSREVVAPDGDISQSSELLTEEEIFDPQLCNFAPTGDYMLCCENEAGEEVDCTEKTVFNANEKVTIIVNPKILQNEEAPYTLCERSNLLASPDIIGEAPDGYENSSCIDIMPDTGNFVLRTEGFVPSVYTNEALTLLELSTAQVGNLDSQEVLLNIERSLDR